MIELRDDQLAFAFAEVHERARCRIEFQRTLRIPDDNHSYPLPAGLGRFPMHHVDDFEARLPASWGRHGGVFLPMYQTEALWINFIGESGGDSYPCAVKVAAGKINAVTGDPWMPALQTTPQDYLVLPDQRWLDGYAVGEGLIRQFVAMPLGAGYSAEEQLTGQAEHGGLQILVYPMKRQAYRDLMRKRERQRKRREKAMMDFGLEDVCESAAGPCPPQMALAAGGLMTQAIERDPYGLDAWDQSVSARCFVHLTDSRAYLAITGREPPHQPPSREDYARAGIPWFHLEPSADSALPGSAVLAGLDSVATKHFKQTQTPMPDNASMAVEKPISLSPPGSVREGEF